MFKNLFLLLENILLSDRTKVIGLVFLSLILITLPWLYLGYLSLLINLLSIIALLIYISSSYDLTIPILGVILKRYYFKVKFKMEIVKSRAEMLGQIKDVLYLLKYSYYQIILAILHYLILLFKSSAESFTVLKEDLYNIYSHSVYIRHRADQLSKGEKLTVKTIEQKLSQGEKIDPQIIQKLDDLFYKLHNQKQKRATVFSLASLSILIAGSVIVGLLTSFIFPHIFFSRASTNSYVQSDWSGGADTAATSTHPTNQAGWTKYYSQTGGVNTSGGELKLERYSN